jgi:hypothetical protein
MERRSPKIGVDYHSGRIDEWAEPKLDLKINLPPEEGIEVFEGKRVLLHIGEFFFIEKLLAQSLQSISYGIDHDRPRIGP